MTRSNQTELSDLSIKFWVVCVQEEKLPIKEMGNKVVLIVKSWLLVCAKFYCLIYVTFWKGEVISLRGLACEEALTALCSSEAGKGQGLPGLCPPLPPGCSAGSAWGCGQQGEVESSELNWRNRNWRGKSRHTHPFSDREHGAW